MGGVQIASDILAHISHNDIIIYVADKNIIELCGTKISDNSIKCMMDLNRIDLAMLILDLKPQHWICLFEWFIINQQYVKAINLFNSILKKYELNDADTTSIINLAYKSIIHFGNVKMTISDHLFRTNSTYYLNLNETSFTDEEIQKFMEMGGLLCYGVNNKLFSFDLNNYYLAGLFNRTIADYLFRDLC